MGSDLSQLIADAAEPLPDIDDPEFGAAFDRFGDARVVLIGEASHGTSEFYRARAAITRRLIERHGFTIVAAEADWPDAAVINAHVRGRPADQSAEPPFERFPTWMWRNSDVDAFVGWLRDWNHDRDVQTGFYGLDLYNMSGSVRAVIAYLERTDPEAAAEARQRYACLRPWMDEPQRYGLLASRSRVTLCEEPTMRMLQDLHARQMACQSDCDRVFDAAANARLVANAESYYRAMFSECEASWNVRDTHMFETLCALLDARGPNSKAVVWAHNSHIGDARATEMGRRRGELNIGQLCRTRFGSAARLIGQSTHEGTVAAAGDWNAPMEIKTVNPSRPDSYERLAHDSGVPRFLLDLREGVHDTLRAALSSPRLERFIGVIYRPATERWSHYTQAVLPDQFDALIWFDRTSAVTPTGEMRPKGSPDTYPEGL